MFTFLLVLYVLGIAPSAYLIQKFQKEYQELNDFALAWPVFLPLWLPLRLGTLKGEQAKRLKAAEQRRMLGAANTLRMAALWTSTPLDEIVNEITNNADSFNASDVAFLSAMAVKHREDVDIAVVIISSLKVLGFLTNDNDILAMLDAALVELSFSSNYAVRVSATLARQEISEFSNIQLVLPSSL